MFETLLWWLTVAFVGVSVIGIAGFFVVRWAFLRVATRMSLAIERRVGGVATQAFTRIGRYARATGIDLAEANRRFGTQVDGLARLMDSAVTLPLVGPIGLDAVLGLVPVAGDVVGAVVSLVLVARSLEYGPSTALISRMLANVLTDFILGAIPFVGVLADIWFRANDRNAQLLREFLESRPSGATSGI
ncbi:MAG: DUF4112 domain-containing protein [Vicinamibacterales bacterium]